MPYSAGIVSPLRFDLWTDDDYPEWHQVQIQHQLACDPTLDYGYLAALCPPKGFLKYRVERNPSLIAAIIEAEIIFWQQHVVKDIPPECAPSMDVCKRLKRTPKKVTLIDGEIVALWQERNAARKLAEQEEEQAKAAVIAALGDAEIGRFPMGVVTFYETNRAGYQVKATKFRTLRTSKKG